jgi:predicted nucleic acid-binding protein
MSMSVYEEAFYVGITILAEDRLNIKGKFDVKAHIKRNGYAFAEDFIARLNQFCDHISLIDDTKDINLIKVISENYRLLPNDALIAATCKHYGIPKIATFDPDFEGVDFLEIVTE